MIALEGLRSTSVRQFDNPRAVGTAHLLRGTSPTSCPTPLPQYALSQALSFASIQLTATLHDVVVIVLSVSPTRIKSHEDKGHLCFPL